METTRPIWDIFCKVVDNFGDIGVCWRLSRQLAAEYDLVVRLWIDDLVTFQRINAAIDVNAEAQTSYGVEVKSWRDPFVLIEPADVVIETFGCETPENYQQAMAAQAKKPVWINLEYLSAESWVNGCHRLPSFHPRLPLVKHFFFPGFNPHTGGVLRERDLIGKREAFLNDALAKSAFWQALQLPSSSAIETRISLFCYENPAIPELLTTWANGDEPIRCIVPEGKAADQVKAFFLSAESFTANAYQRGNLKAHIMPFVDQPNYDRLLWECDCNFVRGEDSFVRAQWAMQPFIWHIYPQTENAHWVKLNTFIDQYCAQMASEPATDLRAFWRTWNSGRGVGTAWPKFWRHRRKFELHMQFWLDSLIEIGDLAGNLIAFSKNIEKSL